MLDRLLESVLAQTSLPNLHPAFVHFPIALIVVALLSDVAGLLLPRLRFLLPMGAALWVLGALAALAASRTGEQAEELMGIVDPIILAAVEEHEEWAERTVWAAGIVAAVRLAVAYVGARRERPWRPGLALTLLLGGAATFALAETADHGGALVYRHAVGVILPAAAPAPLAEPATAAESASGEEPQAEPGPSGTATSAPVPAAER